MWFKERFFKIAVAILLVLLIIVLIIEILPFLSSILQLIMTLVFPFLFSILLYYILRPVRDFIQKKFRLGITTTIFIIYCMLIGFIALVITFIWPALSSQIAEFTAAPQEKIKAVENKTMEILNLFNFGSLTREELIQVANNYLQSLFEWFSQSIFYNLSSLTQIASYVVITPFVLFYLLKEDHIFHAELIRNCPIPYQLKFRKLLDDSDQVLSDFISSQIMVAGIVSLLIFIGYSLIGLNHAFFLAMVAFIFNLIPFFGPFISTIPAVLIGIAESIWMPLEVIAVVLIVHLIDLNLISPRLVGSRLEIHPVTIVILLIGCIATVGALGLFLIVPLYAVFKKAIVDIYEMYFLQEEPTEQH